MILLEPKVRKIRNFFDRPDLVVAEARGMYYEVKDAAYQGFESTGHVPEWVVERIVARLRSLNLPHLHFFHFSKPRYRLALVDEKPSVGCPHVDGKYGNLLPLYSLIIYLNEPAPGEKLCFYEHDTMGRSALAPGYKHTDAQEDKSRWKLITEVPIERNCALLFPSLMFHAPVPDTGRGFDVDTGRLIIPVFVTVGFDPNVDALPDAFSVEEL